MDVSFEERLLATIPDEWEVADTDTTIIFSPNGRTVAYVVQSHGKDTENPMFFVVVNGRKERDVSRVGSHRGMCGFCGNGKPVFTPDGRRFAYAFREGTDEDGHEGVMIDGKAGPFFDDVSDPVFSRDGGRVAYEAEEKGKKFVVFDHQPCRDFDRADTPVFSPDGQRTAYRAYALGEPDEDGDRPTRAEFIVVVGVKGDEYDSVSWPVFHPNGKTVAYAAKRGDKYRMVGITPPIEGFDYLDNPTFSPDGKRMACVAGRGGRFFVLLDGREVRSEFESVADPLFSPDGRRLAFRGIRDSMELFGELPPLQESDGRECMVVDGEVGEDNEFIWEPHFSPDSRRLIYSMSQKDHWYLVFGKEKYGQEFNHIGNPAVSPDGSRLAFVAEVEDGSIVVCGTQRSERFDYIPGRPVFSRNGKKLAFGARKGRELWWKVIEVK